MRIISVVFVISFDVSVYLGRNSHGTENLQHVLSNRFSFVHLILFVEGEPNAYHSIDRLLDRK